MNNQVNLIPAIKTNNMQKYKLYTSFVLCLAFIPSAYAAESRNPFTKPAPVVVAPPTILPTNPTNIGNLGNNLPMTAPMGLPMVENTVLPFDWENLKVVGYINDNIILRIYDRNPQVEPRTLLTTFNSKFLINRQYYTIKNNNKVFTIFNKSNQPVHRLNFESSPTRLIVRNNGQVNAPSANPSNNTPGATSGPAR